jgi:TPR repeat protein
MSRLLKISVNVLVASLVGTLVQPVVAAESKKLLKDTPFEEVVAKAKAGDGEAQLYLANGHSLLIGGVPYNKPESHRWYLAAATNGLVEAELYLGNHYYQESLANRGAAAKDKAARNQTATASLSWNFKAAKQGSAEAWRRLGTAFDEGKVYAKDPVEAYKWYHLVIEKGGSQLVSPVTQRNALSLKLTPAQIELAKRRAQDFWDSLGEEKKPTAPK